MYELKNVDLEKEMDKALHFTAKKLEESGHNSKPVLLHSFKVSMTLYTYGYDRDIVIAAILHDLIEDTDTIKEEIEKEYGTKIASIVEAVSFDSNIEDKLLQEKTIFENCIKYGKEALLVKCSDLLDNSNYISLADNSLKPKLLEKYKMFVDMTKEYLKEEIIYNKLIEKIKEKGINI